MGTNRFYFLMLVFLLFLLGYLTFKIISPFLTAIAWAIVFSIVFFPVYLFISRYIKIKSVASLITTILIFLVIIGPFTYISVLLIDELRGIASSLAELKFSSVREFFNRPQLTGFFEKIASHLGVQDVSADEIIVENVKKIGKVLIENLSIKFTNVITAAVNFVFMILTVFFLLKDGPGFLSKAKQYLPFNEEQKERLASQVNDMVISTVYGGTVVAIIQGMLCGVSFYVFGIEHPVFWGISLAVMSFVPFLGAFSIWGPHAGYLLIQGAYLKGLGLFLFGFFVISMVDNILKPIIIGSRTQMPIIIILFSVLGGIKLFGLIGLIMGPLIMAVFLSVFEIFRNIEGGAHVES